MVETPEANLAKGMRQLNGVYTQYINREHERVGHVFQGRYKAILVEQDAYLLELARYVVLNPVRAGMVGDAGAWSWSSYRAMTGEAPMPAWLCTAWLLGQFGKKRKRAIAKYVDFVRAGVGLPPIWAELRHQIYLGGDGFIERVQREIGDGGELGEVPRLQRRAPAMPLEKYAAAHDDSKSAMAAAYLSGDHSMKAVAEHFGVHYSTVSRAVRAFEMEGGG